MVAELGELSLQIPTALPSRDMPAASSIFKMNKDVEDIQIDVEDPAKTMQIGASLEPK
jgi:hypothetical protein